MKLLANIAYHHHPNRVENLTKVIEAIKSYPVHSDIFVDTNDPQAAQELAHLPVTFHTHTAMGPPWELTSKHATGLQRCTSTLTGWRISRTT